ncbi:urea ABC transporter permease subunit UrtC, partial [Klebsiella pneumoniae]|nr:urea ABC transporter permease subunit UrtC [Klebsiella pneumoniae]
RGSLLGAVYGALIVNAAKSSISESFPELWTIAMGLLFIAVVLIFPKGLAGLYQQYIHPIVMSLLRKKSMTKPRVNTGVLK